LANRYTYYEPVVSPIDIAAAAAPDLSWAPTYPDFAREALNTAALKKAFFAPDQKPAAAINVDWKSTYPSLLLPKKDPTEFKTWYARPPNLEFFAVPDLSWNPSYPSFTRSKQSVVEHPAFFAVFALPQFPIPENSWEPVYPNFTRKTPSLYMTTFFFYTSALPHLLIDLWQPAYGGGGVYKNRMTPSGQI